MAQPVLLRRGGDPGHPLRRGGGRGCGRGQPGGNRRGGGFGGGGRPRPGRPGGGPRRLRQRGGSNGGVGGRLRRNRPGGGGPAGRSDSGGRESAGGGPQLLRRAKPGPRTERLPDRAGPGSPRRPAGGHRPRHPDRGLRDGLAHPGAGRPDPVRQNLLLWQQSGHRRPRSGGISADRSGNQGHLPHPGIDSGGTGSGGGDTQNLPRQTGNRLQNRDFPGRGPGRPLPHRFAGSRSEDLPSGDGTGRGFGGSFRSGNAGRGPGPFLPTPAGGSPGGRHHQLRRDGSGADGPAPRRRGGNAAPFPAVAGNHRLPPSAVRGRGQPGGYDPRLAQIRRTVPLVAGNPGPLRGSGFGDSDPAGKGRRRPGNTAGGAGRRATVAGRGGERPGVRLLGGAPGDTQSGRSVAGGGNSLPGMAGTHRPGRGARGALRPAEPPAPLLPSPAPPGFPPLSARSPARVARH